MKFIRTISRAVLIVMAVSVLAIATVAQEKKITGKDVPAAVMTAFKTAYPNATIRGYAREKENGKVFYEIESREGTTTRDVLYNPDGTVAEIEESIAAADLPAEVQQAMKEKYPKAVITKAERTTAGDKVSYEIVARQGKKRVTVEFDSSGKVLTNK
ncbi:MAG TPA: PepSY-like domain-containing protein [Pyrinomonadaceae bacterium]|nr:PepSY-like domain-containing protein [Pyrinomonadaceae bacterium]